MTIARPGICSSARSITSGSVESIWIGAGWVREMRLASRRICSSSSAALGQRHAQVEHVRAAGHLVLGDLHEPVVVVGEQQLLGLARALRVDALAHHRRSRLLHERWWPRSSKRGGGRGARAAGLTASRRRARRWPRCARASCRSSHPRCRRRSARRTPPAPPPAARAARGRSSRRRAPAAAGRRWGCRPRARGQNSPRKRIASRMSSGPVEQFSPITSTFSASSVHSTAEMSVPSSILPPLGSSETEVWIGSVRPVLLKASRAPNTAALTSRMSCAVSMMIRSAPPSISPAACSAKTSTSSRKRIWPERWILGGRQEAGRPDRAGHEAALARRVARDFRRLGVDLHRVVRQPPLAQLQARGLEGVGLDHLRAGLQHRGVHALDHVGPVEHERLVALALQPAVVLRW